MNNAQQLNITTLLDTNTNNINYTDDNVMVINNMFNNNVSNKYQIKKYLGQGIQGSLYIALDKNNKKYICKKINLNSTINPNQEKQLNFELNLLKYLSSNKVTREYINPCLEHKIVENQVFTIFPIFNGFSLNHIKQYLLKMNHKHYYKILFHLIKVILHGLAKIHQHNVAHQNINGNSILVSTYGNTDNLDGVYNLDNNIDEIKIKFTDFGLGCGVNNSYINDVFYDINSCNTTTMPNTMSNKITNSIIKKLSKSNYLSIAQNADIMLLCTIFIQLLLFFENIKLNVSQGYNNNEIIKKQLKQIITEKFLSKIEKYRKNKYKVDDDELLFLNTTNETKRDILEYLNIFNDYVLCEGKDRQSCQYILDKLIIYEKYKNEVF
jgi:serine/threonine protein kinase